MKTSEIPAFIEARNIKLFIGGVVPFFPLIPTIVVPRTRQQVGWCAFNLIRSADPDLLGNHAFPLCVNRELEAFAHLNLEKSEGLHGAWELVEWDGYGEVKSWEVICP
jgi:hypothetical protein